MRNLESQGSSCADTGRREGFTPDNPPTDERFEGSAELMQYRTEFTEDGTLNTLMFVPEEMREEAAKHGAVVREDGYAAIESTVWKEENGKFYYDTKIEGEVLGEKVDSFAEIPSLRTAVFCTDSE